MDASLPLWVFFAAAALPVSAAAVVFALQNRAGRDNAPRIVPNDVEKAVALVGDKLRRLENRVTDLENGVARRDAELADALDRFSRMTQRLAVRADREHRNGKQPDETGTLEAVLARRGR